jgi:hypothetical protein
MNGLRSNITLGKKLGSGFFGEVFQAHDEVHGDVAVKVVHQYVGESDADWLARRETIMREGRRLSQAEHDNVVRYIMCRETRRPAYLGW